MSNRALPGTRPDKPSERGEPRRWFATFNNKMNNCRLKYAGVEIDGDGIHQVQCGSRVLSIPRVDVVSLKIVKCLPTERPFLQGILGTVLSVVGAIGTYWMIGAILKSDFPGHRYSVIAINLPLGLWLLNSVIRKRPFLLIGGQAAAPMF